MNKCVPAWSAASVGQLGFGTGLLYHGHLAHDGSARARRPWYLCGVAGMMPAAPVCTGNEASVAQVSRLAEGRAGHAASRETCATLLISAPRGVAAKVRLGNLKARVRGVYRDVKRVLRTQDSRRRTCRPGYPASGVESPASCNLGIGLIGQMGRMGQTGLICPMCPIEPAWPHFPRPSIGACYRQVRRAASPRKDDGVSGGQRLEARAPSPAKRGHALPAGEGAHAPSRCPHLPFAP